MRTQTEEDVKDPRGGASIRKDTGIKPAANSSMQSSGSKPGDLQGECETVSAAEKQQLLENLDKTLNGQAHESTTEAESSPLPPAAEDDPVILNQQPSDETEVQGAIPSSEDDPITDTPAHDIVYMRGNKVLLALTPPPRPGEAIKFRGKKYTLTKGPLDKKTLGVAAALVLVFAIVILVQQLAAPAVPQPMLFGIVKNSETNEVLAGVNVSIPKLNIFTVTDEYGAFRFAGLGNNTYQVKVESDLYQARTYPVNIADNGSAFLHASLEPLSHNGRSSGKRTAANDKPAVTKPQLGQLKINCNVEDAQVIVNGKDLGTTERTFTRMKTGNLTLLVRHEGYDDFTQPIKIDPGETTVVAVNLLKTAPEKPKELTAADHFAKAEELMQYHKYTEAAGHYTLALAKDHDYVQAYLRRADANVALGKNLAARADYRAAADYYLNSGRYTNALQCFNKILDLSPNSVGALQMRGWCKIWSNDKQGGLFDLNRALSIVPNDVDARFQVGKALYVIGNYKEAEKSLQKLKDDADQKPEIYAYLALTSLARGDEKDARKAYQKFQELASSTLQARLSTESAWDKLVSLEEK